MVWRVGNQMWQVIIFDQAKIFTRLTHLSNTYRLTLMKISSITQKELISTHKKMISHTYDIFRGKEGLEPLKFFF